MDRKGSPSHIPTLAQSPTISVSPLNLPGLRQGYVQIASDSLESLTTAESLSTRLRRKGYPCPVTQGQSDVNQLLGILCVPLGLTTVTGMPYETPTTALRTVSDARAGRLVLSRFGD
jgi:hypothetical protein